MAYLVCVNKKEAEHGPVLPSMPAEATFTQLLSYATELCMSIADGCCILSSQLGYFIASCRLGLESSVKVRALVSRTLSQSSYVCNINLVTT